MIENLLIQSQLSNPDNLSGLIILAASIAASMKFLLLGASVALIAYYIFLAASSKTHSI